MHLTRSSFALALVGMGAFASCRKASEPALPPAAPIALPATVTTVDAGASSRAAESDALPGKPRFDGGASAVAVAPDPEPPTEADRLRSGAKTRGAILCGAAVCAPGREACASLTDWQCVLANAPSDQADVYFCDDGTDCPQGQTCCLSFASAVSARVCSKRRGPDHQCRLEICAEGGALCPKGQVCKDRVCMAPDRTATCGNSGRCPSDKPFCLWSPTRTRCVSWEQFEAEQTEEQRALLGCSKPADCGPEASCCTNGIWDATQCLTNCDPANNGQICATDADCRGVGGDPRKGRCLVQSEATLLPPWLKICDFGS